MILSKKEEQIIRYLGQEFTQQEISDKLKVQGIDPNSLSSIEKACALLRKKFKPKTSFQLAVLLCKKNHI